MNRPRRAFLIVTLLAGGPWRTAVAEHPVPAIPFAPRAAVCPRTAVPPVIDGRLDDDAWRQAPATAPFVDIRGGDRPDPRFVTTARLAWDDSCLYIGAALQEPHVWGTLTRRDAVIYHDNDFEVFLDPDGDNHHYYELEINALGTEWDLLLVRPYRDGGPAVDAWDIAGLRTAVAVDGTLNDPADRDRGWSVEMAIPWAVLAEAAGRPAPPADGDIWRLNFSRVQWRTRVVDGRYEKIPHLPEDNWVWSPQGLVAMHYPEMWGMVLFVDELPADPAARLRETRETGHIQVAQYLMAVYHRQRQHRERTGAFARDLPTLGFPPGALPVRAMPDDAAPTHVPLPVGWTLTMEAGGEQFLARLTTPQLVVTVDHEGRLRRSVP
jgi:hypothetical protein